MWNVYGVCSNLASSGEPPASHNHFNHSPREGQSHIIRVVFVGGSRGTSPSLDRTFPPTGLSENLGGMERGRGGKGEREGWGDHLPYFPHWLLPQIRPCI